MAARRKINRIRLRMYLDGGGMFGPGKADLLEHIAERGSIAAAGRQLGMSYKRAWSLVEAMNAMFKAPLVESTRGGAGHGGARLTKEGVRVLSLYRGIEEKTRSGAAQEFRAFERMLACGGDAHGAPPSDIAKRK